MPIVSGPKGAPDLFPPESERQRWIIGEAEKAFRLFGYRAVETPVFENTELFLRGLAAGSDIVTKEMYTFQDKGGRSLTLRPDMTAPVMRAVLEQGLDRGSLPVKLFYVAPVFRHERPQSGRFRQFKQVGVEAVGAAGPSIDAEVIVLASHILSAVGLAGAELRLNTIGHPGCRSLYLPALVRFLESRSEDLCPDCRRKIDTNPLRTFDCKQPADHEIMQEAPVLTDHLCAECKEHYETLKGLLGTSGVAFIEDPRLVRGLDYYSRTTFEFVAPGLGSQNAVGAGGRYDGLAEQLGAGGPLPGIGFGLGLERMALALKGSGDGSGKASGTPVEVFVVHVGDQANAKAFELVTRLRREGVPADLDHTGRGLKGQFRAAGRSGAAWVVVIGERELESGSLTLKDMRGGDEVSVSEGALVSRVKPPAGPREGAG